VLPTLPKSKRTSILPKGDLSTGYRLLWRL
jgi:hypothetical protein